MVTFDDQNLVSNTGRVSVAKLTRLPGLEALVNTTVKLIGRVGGARPGRKALTLVQSMIAGGTHIDHADTLRAGPTGDVVNTRMQPDQHDPHPATTQPAGATRTFKLLLDEIHATARYRDTHSAPKTTDAAVTVPVVPRG